MRPRWPGCSRMRLIPSEVAPSSRRRVWKRSSPSKASVTTCICGVLDAADLRRRPVAGERLADHVAHGDRTPVAAVVGGAAVVAHEEDVALGDADRLREVAAVAAAAWRRERFLGWPA